jgi:hypothetical protein
VAKNHQPVINGMKSQHQWISMFFLFLPPQLEIAGFKKDPELPDAKSAQEEEQRQVGRNKGGCLPGFQGDFSNVFSLLHKKLQRIKMI